MAPDTVAVETQLEEMGGKDRIAWLLAQDSSTQCLITAACSFVFILLFNAQFVGVGVYCVALFPGVIQCKRALNLYGDAVTKESFMRSALAGFYFTLLVCALELLAEILMEIFAIITMGINSMSYIVLTAFIEAFCIAGFFEETTKALVTRRAVKYERADSASAILAHSIAGAATFATLENIFYLSFKDTGNQAVSYTVLFVRTFLCVPLHICWGLSNGAGIGISRMASTNTIHVILPSVILHGLWDLPLFLLHKGSRAYTKYCDLTKPCVSDDYTKSILSEVVASVYISLAFFFIIPALSFFLCWRRIALLRTVEAGDFSDLEQSLPAQAHFATESQPTLLVSSPLPTITPDMVPPPPEMVPPPAAPSNEVITWTRAEVAIWLTNAGLDQYAEAFKAISGAMLVALTDDDLKELGVNISVHRRAIRALYTPDANTG
jgi:RsiW-degrading membrane proteinase PrsW (M82 family)